MFASVEEAARAAPDTKPVTHSSPELAAERRMMLEQENWERRGGLLFSYDYPVLFWLGKLLADASVRTVFDFGGSVGVHFYTYAGRLHFPPDLQWTICEMPDVVEAGRQIAAERAADLAFTTSFAEADGRDLLVASGVIQYVEDLGGMLRDLRRPPRHLLLNRVPLYDGERFVTLQNEGSVFCPQWMFNREEFLGSLLAAGYELVDGWDDPAEGCSVPFHATVAPYSGLYLTCAGGFPPKTRPAP
jgi:putative methyltransferase (TIGR04325 family)